MRACIQYTHDLGKSYISSSVIKKKGGISKWMLPADLVTFTEEILNGKPHFLSSECVFSTYEKSNQKRDRIFQPFYAVQHVKKFFNETSDSAKTRNYELPTFLQTSHSSFLRTLFTVFYLKICSHRQNISRRVIFSKSNVWTLDFGKGINWCKHCGFGHIY